MPDSIYFEFHQGIEASSGCWYNCVQLLGPGGNVVTF
jgi:hypothetical protein